jgi:hypothetical protein
MSSTQQPETAHLGQVRDQLTHWLARFHRQEFRSGHAQIGESFRCYSLAPSSASAASAGSTDVSSLLVDTHMWHHQIIAAASPVGIAHSQRAADGSWQLINFFISQRAARFARAVQRVDQDRPDDDIEVRLVKAPSRHLDFFLLTRAATAEAHLIASATRGADLAEGRFYTLLELLRILSAHPAPAGLSRT